MENKEKLLEDNIDYSFEEEEEWGYIELIEDVQ